MKPEFLNKPEGIVKLWMLIAGLSLCLSRLQPDGLCTWLCLSGLDFFGSLFYHEREGAGTLDEKNRKISF